MRYILVIVGVPAVLGMSLFLIAELHPHLITIPYLKYEYSRKKEPGLYQVPVIRQISVPEDRIKQYSLFRAFLLSLRPPWRNIRQERKTDAMIMFTSEDGRMIQVWNEVMHVGVINEFKKEPALTEEKLANFFGKENIASNFVFYRFILNTTPDKLSIFDEKTEALAKSIAVMHKRIIVLPKSGLYEFAVNEIKGFQNGIPGTDESIMLEVFDSQDHWYTLVIKGKDVTQDEIDIILTSIKIN